MRRTSFSSPAALSLVAYGVCLLLVLSFIAFEVLDVDGSDFTSSTRASASTSCDPPEQLRRAPNHVTAALPVALAVEGRAEVLRLHHRVDGVRSDTPPPPSLRHSSRTTLARGLLADLVRPA